jgi:hypothetical protein
VTLTKGKGAVGMAWQHAEEQYSEGDYVVWRRSRDWPGVTPTAAEWPSIADDAKMGLTQDEAQRLKNYEVVFAFPIVRITTSGLATAEPHCVGVLSVDCADDDFDHVHAARDEIGLLVSGLAKSEF